MDFSASETQLAVSEAAGAILGARSPMAVDPPYAFEPDRWFDREAWAKLAAADLLGVGLGTGSGGTGGGLLEICSLLVEAGRHLSRTPVLCTLVAAHLLDRYGAEAHRNGILAAVVRGEAVLSLAFQESPGDDPYDVRALAERDGTGWRVTGRKLGVPFGREATRILVPARHQGRVLLAAVDPAAPGVSMSDLITTNGEPQVALGLDGVAVAAEDMVGWSAAEDVHRWVFERYLVALSALHAGIAHGALAATAAHVRDREQFGRALGSFQAVAAQAADAYVDVQAMEATLWQAAWLLTEERAASDEVRIAKFWAADAGQRVIATAQHLHGGVGVDLDHGLHQYLLWSKNAELTGGSASAQVAALASAMSDAATTEGDAS